MGYPELKVAIIRRGKRQYRVCQELGGHWTPAKLSHIIHGAERITSAEMRELSEYLRIPIKTLFAESQAGTAI